MYSGSSELTVCWSPVIIQKANSKKCELSVLAHCDLTVYLEVRNSGELTVSMVLAHTFTGYTSSLGRVLPLHSAPRPFDWIANMNF